MNDEQKVKCFFHRTFIVIIGQIIYGITKIERQLENERMNIENQSDIVILEDLCQSKRGGHSLSLIDLLEGQTLDLELSAWLISHVSQGASYIIGAGPGGVGKTTTMRALLSVIPDDRPFGIALPGEVYNTLCHSQPALKKNKNLLIKKGDQSFKNAKKISSEQLCLPLYPGLKDVEIKYVAHCLKKLLNDFA